LPVAGNISRAKPTSRIVVEARVLLCLGWWQAEGSVRSAGSIRMGWAGLRAGRPRVRRPLKKDRA